jgi:23S rRNA (uracil1939-C5)-methyltransferase
LICFSELPVVREAIGVEGEPFFYRNKMEFSFSDERWLMEDEIASGAIVDRFALGLHVRERFDRVIDAHTCLLPSPVAPKIVNFTREFTRANALGVFAPDKNPEGLLRFLVTRTSGHTKDVMVNIVTSRFEKSVMEDYREGLLKAVPEVTTIVNNINGRRAQVAQGDSEELIYGTGFITDRIGSNSYQISANSFFQTNTLQAERLYEIACEFADLRKDDVLWDLYCGAGTITLFAAPFVKQVLGIELAESAVRDARTNATSNKVEHVEFVASDLRNAITSPEFIAAHAKPDVMIIDPPRSGMHTDVVREVIALAPQRISYISCNPATQARDIEMMSEKYELIELQPVDMFPQTFHIECVAKLRRKS